MAGNKAQSLAVGLTGGPGVGKSEVAAILAADGASIINADAIGHRLLNESKAVRRQLIKLFGDRIFDDGGAVDRREIGRLVFNDTEALRLFNRIIHPPLLRMLKRELDGRINRRSNRIVVVDAALIFEWGIADWFDIILVVNARRKIRLRRISGGGISLNQAGKRIASQMPQRDKMALADYVIDNNSSRVNLKREVKKFVKKIEDADLRDFKL
jgi:dephospho-CoA kinase